MLCCNEEIKRQTTSYFGKNVYNGVNMFVVVLILYVVYERLLFKKFY